MQHARKALDVAKRHRRGTASAASVALIGALAVGTLGAGTAAAHGMVSSNDVTNQSLNSWDIGANQVGASELRGPAHDSGSAVMSHHVRDQSLGHWDIKDQTLGHWDIRDGTIGIWDLNKSLTDKINNGNGGGGEIPENSVGKRELDEDTVGKLARIGPPKVWSMTNLDGQTDLPGDQVTQVAALNVSGPVKVDGHVTVSGENQGNMVCSLTTDVLDGNIAEANEKVSAEGQQNASMTLTGVASESGTGTVVLNCSSGDGGFATDVSLTATQVAPASGSEPVNN